MTNLTEIATPTVRSSFVRSGETLIRTLETPGGAYATHIEIDTGDEDLLAEWWRGYLRGQKPIHLQPTTTVSTAELFCGPGGLAQGFGQAALETGHIPRSLAAADLDPEAVSVYESNHRPETSSSRSVTELIDYRVRWRDGVAEFRFEPELIDDDWARHIGEIDVLMAGPPCQGHSNLNNHSRRTDKRNELYLSVAAFAVATKAQAVIIENVPAVVHDRLGVVAATKDLLRAAGYHIETGIIRADRLGWFQRRSRFFLVARLDTAPLPIDEVTTALEAEAQPVLWALEDLVGAEPDDHMNRRPAMSAENRSRVDYLFEHNLYELPLSERPDCHKDGTTYNAVYGRMYPDRPAPTITTGFLTPGRGRYIHPTEPRVLTPAEAARLQGFPDTYLFDLNGDQPPSSAKLTKWIGDAVPMPLGFAAGLSVLGAGPFAR